MRLGIKHHTMLSLIVAAMGGSNKTSKFQELVEAVKAKIGGVTIPFVSRSSDAIVASFIELNTGAYMKSFGVTKLNLYEVMYDESLSSSDGRVYSSNWSPQMAVLRACANNIGQEVNPITLVTADVRGFHSMTATVSTDFNSRDISVDTQISGTDGRSMKIQFVSDNQSGVISRIFASFTDTGSTNIRFDADSSASNIGVWSSVGEAYTITTKNKQSFTVSESFTIMFDPFENGIYIVTNKADHIGPVLEVWTEMNLLLTAMNDDTGTTILELRTVADINIRINLIEGAIEICDALGVKTRLSSGLLVSEGPSSRFSMRALMMDSVKRLVTEIASRFGVDSSSLIFSEIAADGSSQVTTVEIGDEKVVLDGSEDSKIAMIELLNTATFISSVSFSNS